MSSSLNVTSATGTPQWSQANNPFQQLSQALASGNLSAAQQAYAAIQQNAPQGAVAQNGQGSTQQNAFAALGQALQSGNLAAAQQAFAQLQQAGGHHHHHHHGQESQAASSASGDTLTITGNSGTINIIEGTSNGTASAAGNTVISGNTGTINITA
ncbi:MAG: hypothetical protein ABSH53_01345 [Holophaga sp.]|jgi:hypothetical protein